MDGEKEEYFEEFQIIDQAEDRMDTSLTDTDGLRTTRFANSEIQGSMETMDMAKLNHASSVNRDIRKRRISKRE